MANENNQREQAYASAGLEDTTTSNTSRSASYESQREQSYAAARAANANTQTTEERVNEIIANNQATTASSTVNLSAPVWTANSFNASNPELSTDPVWTPLGTVGQNNIRNQFNSIDTDVEGSGTTEPFVGSSSSFSTAVDRKREAAYGGTIDYSTSSIVGHTGLNANLNIIDEVIQRLTNLKNGTIDDVYNAINTKVVNMRFQTNFNRTSNYSSCTTDSIAEPLLDFKEIITKMIGQFESAREFVVDYNNASSSEQGRMRDSIFFLSSEGYEIQELQIQMQLTMK